MDVYLRSMLRHHSLRPILPQLQNLVFPRIDDDHIHFLVSRYRIPSPWPGGSTIHLSLSLCLPLPVSLSLFLPLSPSTLSFFNARLLMGRRTGGGSEAFGTHQIGFVFHGGDEHPLHIRRPCRHSVSTKTPSSMPIPFRERDNLRSLQGDHARDVETAEVQIDLLASNSVRAHADASVGDISLLGIRRRASRPLKRFRSPPQIILPRCRGHPDAHPPGTDQKS